MKSNRWYTILKANKNGLVAGDRIFLYKHSGVYYIRRERGLVSFRVGTGRTKKGGVFVPWFDKLEVVEGRLDWAEEDRIWYGTVAGRVVCEVCAGIVYWGNEYKQFPTDEQAKMWAEEKWLK